MSRSQLSLHASCDMGKPQGGAGGLWLGRGTEELALRALNWSILNTQ